MKAIFLGGELHGEGADLEDHAHRAVARLIGMLLGAGLLWIHSWIPSLDQRRSDSLI